MIESKGTARRGSQGLWASPARQQLWGTQRGSKGLALSTTQPLKQCRYRGFWGAVNSDFLVRVVIAG